MRLDHLLSREYTTTGQLVAWRGVLFEYGAEALYGFEGAGDALSKEGT